MIPFAIPAIKNWRAILTGGLLIVMGIALALTHMNARHQTKRADNLATRLAQAEAAHAITKNSLDLTARALVDQSAKVLAAGKEGEAIREGVKKAAQTGRERISDAERTAGRVEAAKPVATSKTPDEVLHAHHHF